MMGENYKIVFDTTVNKRKLKTNLLNDEEVELDFKLEETGNNSIINEESSSISGMLDTDSLNEETCDDIELDSVEEYRLLYSDLPASESAGKRFFKRSASTPLTGFVEPPPLLKKIRSHDEVTKNNYVETKIEEDDIISLVASSIEGTENYTEVDDTETQNEIPNESIPPPSSNNTKTHDTTYFEEVINKNFVPQEKNIKKVNDIASKKIPNFFHGLCYSFWFKNICNQPSDCCYAHKLNIKKYEIRCRNTPKKNFVSIYNFTLEHKKLYEALFPCFLKGFSFHKMQEELLSCIKHFFLMNINIALAVKLLINELQNTGLDYVDSIELIMTKFEFDQYPLMSDILLDLLTQQNNVDNNWYLIKKIISYKKQIPVNIAEKLLCCVTFLNSCEKSLCLEVNELLFKEKNVDISQINPQLVQSFKAIINRNESSPLLELNSHFSSTPSEDLCNIDLQSVNNNNNYCYERNYQLQNVSNDLNSDQTLILKNLEQKIDLFSKWPIVGKRQYPSNYFLDQSIHYLMPKIVQPKPVNETDLYKLHNAITLGYAYGFLEVFNKNKRPELIQSFIAAIYKTLISMKKPVDTLEALLESLRKVKADFSRDLHLKIIFEVVVMNMLLYFDEKYWWKEATILIQRFRDWDSLISSSFMEEFKTRFLTVKGRYLLLAKLLVLGKHYLYTYEILQTVELGLLKPAEVYLSLPDSRNRDEVLTQFFTSAYRDSRTILVVRDLFCLVFKDDLLKNKFNKYLDLILQYFVAENMISHLYCFSIKMEVFQNYIERSTLHSFVIKLSLFIKQDEMAKLYDYCSNKKIYPPLTGKENHITIKTSSIDTEICIILTTYFYKVFTLNNAVNDLCIDIIVTDNVCTSSQVDIYNTNERIRNVLKQRFGLQPLELKDIKMVQISQVEIEKMLKNM